MTGDAFEYAIKKDVRNNPIIREVDRERHSEMWRAASLSVFLVLVLLFTAWQQFELLQYGYRMEQMQQLYLQVRLRDSGPAQVTEEELLQRFQEARGTLQQRPKTITFRQVVVRPTVTDSARAELSTLADALVVGETYFFREPAHFSFLKELLLERARRSAGRSPRRSTRRTSSSRSRRRSATSSRGSTSPSATCVRAISATRSSLAGS